VLCNKLILNFVNVIYLHGKMYNVKYVYLVFMRLCNLFDFYLNNYLFDKLCSFNHGCQVFKVNVQKQDHSCSIKTV
jgi:hypothetical protein